MYGLYIYRTDEKCLVELFSIENNIFNDIIEGIKSKFKKVVLTKDQKSVTIFGKDYKTIYFYNEHERKEKALGVINGV